jgi:prepilin-type N-terminal cleavage/methylation domain-containing protein
MRRRGFTIIELIITITIMGILMILAVVNITSSQLSARDDKRVGDVQAIASNLESYYIGDGNASSPGTYPGTGDVSDVSNATIPNVLPDIDPKSLQAPGVSGTTKSFISATNTVQTTAGVAPQPTISQYVYQPIQSSGALCTVYTQGCRKFNIYYRTEADNTVHMITSKNQ